MDSAEETNHPAPHTSGGSTEAPDMSVQAKEYLAACINDLWQEFETQAQDMSWMAPTHRAVPSQALGRIKSICQHIPELFGALQAVGATHAAVPREALAMALKKFRTDLDPYECKEVVTMLAGIANGGRSGFDSVIRNRKKGGAASASALPWGAGSE